jgi:hypothetical protein
MVLGESRFIQSATRRGKKSFQSQISKVDTRVNLASRQQKKAIIRAVNLGIERKDNNHSIIEQKSAAGQPRTRSDQQAAGGSSSRLSMSLLPKKST